MKWFQYKIHTTTKDVDLLGEILGELGIAGFEITDNVPPRPEEERLMYTDIPASLPPDDGTAVITFYTEADNVDSEREFYSTGSSLRDEELSSCAPQRPEELIQKLQERIHDASAWFPIEMPAIDFSVEDDAQWKDKWKEHFQSFRAADNIVIQPIWEDRPSFATPDDIVIQIEPSSAFGTGTHATTQLCLAALQNHITQDTTILDVGCGSGILAIAALLSGAKSAFCLDIDPSAIEVTHSNADVNQISRERLQVRQGNILASNVNEIEGLSSYHIVVANILADVIVSLSGVVGQFLKENGILIASGILTEKADEVRNALQSHGFTILEETTQGEWVCITARQKE